MKKLLTAVILAGLVLMLALSATAEPKIYVDYLSNGSGDFKLSGALNQTTKFDLSGEMVGVEIPLDRFMIGGDYGINLTLKDKATAQESDLSYTNIKAGYCLVSNDAFVLNVIASSVNNSVKDDSGSETKMNGILAGLDGTYYFSERAYIEGYVGQSVSASGSQTGISSSDISSVGLAEYRLKVNYLFTPNFGGSLGYMDVNGSMKDKVLNIKEAMDYNAITVGLYYRF